MVGYGPNIPSYGGGATQRATVVGEEEGVEVVPKSGWAFGSGGGGCIFASSRLMRWVRVEDLVREYHLKQCVYLLDLANQLLHKIVNFLFTIKNENIMTTVLWGS